MVDAEYSREITTESPLEYSNIYIRVAAIAASDLCWWSFLALILRRFFDWGGSRLA
jgi:hypothetical protein